MPTSFIDSLARKAGGNCEEPGCRLPRYRVGSRCRAHARRRYRTGHAEGRAVRLNELKEHLRDVKDFLREHRDNRSIQQTISALNRLLADANAGDYSRGLRPDERTARWLAQLHRDGVTGSEVLAMVAAISLHRLTSPRRYPGDDFFKAQTALRVIRLTPGRRRSKAAAGAGRVCRDRVTAATADHMGRLLCERSLGVVAERIARHIFTTPPQAPALSIDAHAPFNTGHHP